MKLSTIFFIVFCVVTIQQNAHASTKCVKLTSTSSCTAHPLENSDWKITCNNTQLVGTSYCKSSNLNYAIGGANWMYNIGFGIGEPENWKHCWCMLTAPVTSRLVYVASFATGDECATNCAQSCLTMSATNSTIRSALLSTVK